MTRYDLVTFRGRLGRVDYVVVPLLNIVVAAAFVGTAILLAKHLLPPSVGPRVVAAATTVAFVEVVACMVSVQARRLRDVGLSGWHVVWLFPAASLALQLSPVLYAVATLALNGFSLLWPGRPSASGGGEDA